MIPPDLRPSLEKSLGLIRTITPVSGGDINAAARVETGDTRYFVKWNTAPLPHMFEVEARGLQLLTTANALRIPRVIALIDQPPALVLEWIDVGTSGKQVAAEALGRGLAQQHRSSAPTYGLDHDNFIGSNPQHNTPSRSWIEFYRDQRLGVQRDLAQRNGQLTSDRARRLDRVLSHLDRWIDESAVTPALLHGDLWGGNYLIDAQGKPVLIDPAVYYGDREAEIAFTELFGGFGARFYAAYHEAWPLDRGYTDRRDLYNLYHLLNHLNLFGEGYGGSVDAILRRYAD
jgi:protein-ribulosamine 3-kinase